MKPEQLERLRELARRALVVPAGERQAFLEGECPDAPDLVEAVQTLIESGDELAPTTPLADTVEYSLGDRPAAETRLFGDYVLERELGRGGMGVVYLARQQSLGRTVALKMILAGEYASPEAIQRFQGEALAAARLAHPAIVPIYEVGDVDGQPFYTMGYVEGMSLAEAVQDAPLEPRVAARLFSKLADALHEGHQQGIVHRDLKPGNILVDAQGQPYVVDFGLAKAADSDHSLTGSDRVLGTPAFMPPEQAAGRSREVGPRSDVYALGATLYCALTGKPPFEAPNPLDTLILVREQDPTPARSLNPLVPRELEAICAKCLRKNPDQRYSDMEALREDLEAYLAGQSVSALRSASPVLDAFLREMRFIEITRDHAWAWIAFAGIVFLTFGATHLLIARNVMRDGPYILVWGVGLAALGLTVVWLASRVGFGTPIERRLASIHWISALGFVGTGLLGRVVGLRHDQLVPILALEASVFLGSISVLVGGEFYLATVLCAVAAILAAFQPAWGAMYLAILLPLGMIFSGLRFFLRRR